MTPRDIAEKVIGSAKNYFLRAGFDVSDFDRIRQRFNDSYTGTVICPRCIDLGYITLDLRITKVKWYADKFSIFTKFGCVMKTECDLYAITAIMNYTDTRFTYRASEPIETAKDYLKRRADRYSEVAGYDSVKLYSEAIKAVASGCCGDGRILNPVNPDEVKADPFRFADYEAMAADRDFEILQAPNSRYTYLVKSLVKEVLA